MSIVFENRDYEWLSLFFSDEVRTYGNELKELINKVLSGESDYEYYGGNCCYMNIRKAKSDLISAFSDSSEDEIYCSLDTLELLEILDEWIEQMEIMKKSKLNKSGLLNILRKIFKS